MASDILTQFFSSFALLSLFAMLGGFLSARWRQPTVVGLLVVGAIIGPNILGIVKDTSIIEVFAEMGAALLLFSIGVEFSIQKILGSGMRALLVASGIIFAGFVAGYEAGVVMDFNYITCIALGACLSFSSTAIFVRILTQRGLISSPTVPLLISVLVIEDIVAVAALTFFSTYQEDSALGEQVEIVSLLFSLVLSLVMMGFAYLVLKRMLGHLVKYFEADKSGEFMILLALGLCVSMSMLAVMLGLSASIGAFLAGSIIAGLSIKNEVEKIISPFSLAFSSFFFLSIGLFISPSSLAASLLFVAFLAAMFILVTFLSVAFFTYLAGFELEDAILSGTSMAVMGEFSLLLAREAKGVVSEFDIVSTSAVIVLATTITSSLLINYRTAITRWLRCCVSPATHEHIGAFRKYVAAVVAEFEGEGSFLARTQATFKSFLRDLTIFAIIGMALLIARRSFRDLSVDAFGYPIHVPTLILAIALVPIALAAINALRELGLLADAISSVFVRFHKGDERAGRRIARDFLFLVPFLVALFTLPIAVDLLKLPDAFHLIEAVPLLACIFISWDAFSTFLSTVRQRMHGSTSRGLIFP